MSPFSVASKQLGREDERDLFPEAIRLVKEMHPRAECLKTCGDFLIRNLQIIVNIY